MSIPELAGTLNATDPDLGELALEAVVARGAEFQYVVADAPQARDLVPMRLTRSSTANMS
jgi:small ligand-binding sensory domain FIST